MLATRHPKRKRRFAWERYHASLRPHPADRGGADLFRRDALGQRLGFSIGGFSSLSDIRQQIAASDFAHDAISQARDYAATHPGLVEAVKAHRPELQELRSRLCSAVDC
jgi:hypothetical protein